MTANKAAEISLKAMPLAVFIGATRALTRFAGAQ